MRYFGVYSVRWSIKQLFPESAYAYKVATAVGWAGAGIGCLYRFRLLVVLSSWQLLNWFGLMIFVISTSALALACLHINSFNNDEPVTPISKVPRTYKLMDDEAMSASNARSAIDGGNEFRHDLVEPNTGTASGSVYCEIQKYEFHENLDCKLSDLYNKRQLSGLFNTSTVVKNPFAVPLVAHIGTVTALSFIVTVYPIYGMFSLPLGIISYCGILNALELLKFVVESFRIRITVVLITLCFILFSRTDEVEMSTLSALVHGSLIARTINVVCLLMSGLYVLFCFICFFLQLVPESFVPYFRISVNHLRLHPMISDVSCHQKNKCQVCISSVQILTARSVCE